MKLTVNRSQSADARGVIHFNAKFRLEVSPEENDKISQYIRKDTILGKVKDICPGATVPAFISETAVYQSENIAYMLIVEQQIKEDVEALASQIDVASKYDGTAELTST